MQIRPRPVDSSGSTKPDALPIATTFLCQVRSWRPDAEADDAGLHYLGVFRGELGRGVFVADEVAGKDVAPVDVALVIDLPAPAGVHRFGGGVGLDGFVGALPAADDRAVVKQRAFEVAKRHAECFFQQQRDKAGAIGIQVGGKGATGGESQAGDTAIVLKELSTVSSSVMTPIFVA